MGHIRAAREAVMRTASKARTMAYVSVGFLTLTAVVGGAAVALTQSDADTGSVPRSPVASVPLPSPVRTAPLTPNHTPGPTAHHASATSPTRSAATATTAAVRVPPLRKLTPPDAIVTLRHAA